MEFAKGGTIIPRSEGIARAFREAYERLAPEHGYETRKASAVSAILADGRIAVLSTGWREGEQ